MKKIHSMLLVILFSITFNSYANIVPLTIEYTGVVDSYFRTNGSIVSLHGETVNGTVDAAWSPRTPYAGGMVINKPSGMSADAMQLVTLFLKNYAGTFPDCWASGYVEGILRIESSSQYPTGTLLELQVDYQTITRDVLPSYYIDRGLMLFSQYYYTLLECTHYTQENIESFYIPITVGETYQFCIWQSLGLENMPIKQSGVGSGVAIDFHVIPEPASLAHIALGGLLLRRRKN